MATVKYGAFETITLPYLVAGAKMKLRIKDSTEDDLYLEDLAQLAVRRIRNLGTFIPAIAQLQIVDLKAKLPEGFVKFNHSYPIRFVDEFGKAVTRGAVAPNFVNNAFFKDSPDASTYWLSGGTVTLVDGYLFFSSDVKEKWVKIEYLSTNIDVNGDIVIPAIAEDAVVAFMCWNYCRTNFDKYGAVMQSYEIEWKKGKQHLRAIFNGSQGYDYPLTSLIMNTLV
jgi:hypothetical protein